MPNHDKTSGGNYSQRIQAACDKLVFDLHAAGVKLAVLRRKLGLAPRSRFMRLHRSEGESPVEAAERKFVDNMRKLGVDDRWEWYLGDSSRFTSSFPEAHDYLSRAFARLERSVDAERVKVAQRKEDELRSYIAPSSHGPATIADILGISAKKPNKAPEPTTTAVTPRAIE